MSGVLAGFWNYGVVFLALITVVVFVHELGHYLVARANGVRVEVFSIGFGPELFGFTARSGTRWKFSLLPLGGYVKMFGDADPSGAAPGVDDGMTAEERRVSFRHKRVGQRAAIAVAGPMANFVFAILVMTAMLLIFGEARLNPVIGTVQPGSAAAAAGLQPGDRVLVANGETVTRFQDLQRAVQLTIDGPLDLTIDRGGQHLTIVAHPRVQEVKDLFGRSHKMPLLGVSPAAAAAEMVRLGPAQAFVAALAETGQMISTTGIEIGQMLIGARPADEIGGPLRIAQVVGDAAKLGLASVIEMSIFISLNLGLVNLVPIPLLDGGHLLFCAIEAARGRPLGARAQEYGFRIGLFLVLALMLFATRNDLADLKVWDFLKGIVS